ncbi:MAG: hypothetical protein EZS28_001662 [Streblomastix strix]|uniref:Tc1-like transposase DDE domain-containing protein n=1 Tax=Streblomastix strix TaxID=222440 RepID=A0A5J4X6B1_9EUKA|nr:MAG: hypothetical protein EZS28_001662 [Streblomastix strix]
MYKHNKKCNQQIRIKEKKGGRTLYKIIALISKFITEEITKKVDIAGQQLADKILDKFELKTHAFSVNQHLREGTKKKNFLQYSIKKIETHEYSRNSLEIKKQRVLFIKSYQFSKVFGVDFIFIDETGFNLTQLRSKGRAYIDEVVKLCKNEKARITHIPPFRCELNPIELVFGFFNRRVHLSPDISSPSTVAPFLDEAFRTVIQQEVLASTNSVVTFVHHLAERKKCLSNKSAITHVKRMVDSHTGDLDDIENMIVFIEGFDNEIEQNAEYFQCYC